MSASVPTGSDAGFLAVRLVDTLIDYLVEMDVITGDMRHAMLRRLLGRLDGESASDDRSGPAADFIRRGMLGEQ